MDDVATPYQLIKKKSPKTFFFQNFKIQNSILLAYIICRTHIRLETSVMSSLTMEIIVLNLKKKHEQNYFFFAKP